MATMAIGQQHVLRALFLKEYTLVFIWQIFKTALSIRHRKNVHSKEARLIFSFEFLPILYRIVLKFNYYCHQLENKHKSNQLLNIPLHAKVREAIRDLILSEFKDGDKFFSEPELIPRFGVSQGTIRRAMLDLSREGLLVRKVPAGTFVCKKNESALSVGIITLASESEFIAGLLSEFSKLCRERQYPVQVYLINPDDDAEEAIRQVQNAPTNEKIVLLCNPPKLTKNLQRSLLKRGFHTVNVDVRIPGYSGNFVGVDDAEGIRLGLKHLVELGHRRIALLVNEPMEAGTIDARVQAFEKLTSKLGLTQSVVVKCETKMGEDSYVAAYNQIDNVLALRPRPTAVFTVSDVGAWATLKRLRELDIAVPQDISVLGLDDDRPSAHTHPALSTIAQPMAEIANRAIELLVKKQTESKTVFIHPTLVVRESTGTSPAMVNEQS